MHGVVKTADRVLDFRKYRKKTGVDDNIDVEEMVTVRSTNYDVFEHNISEEEKALKNLVKSPTGENLNVDNIEKIVTPKFLYSCRDPIKMAFKISCKLRRLADTYTENWDFLNELADQTEDFAVKFIDQVTPSEQLVIKDEPENVDRCASMLSGITDDAIVYSQKKFVSHPLLHKRLKMRWNLGLPRALKPHGKFRGLLYLLILIDTVFTPFLLPVIGYVFYRDQNKVRLRLGANIQEETQESGEKSWLHIIDCYLDYMTAPFVLFIKDKVSQVVFIALHFRVCISPSTVEPKMEEFLIFIFFSGLVLSEYQQYKRSAHKSLNENQQYERSAHKYFKDMWNYTDVLTLVIYIVIVILRVATYIRGGDPYHNRLLEVTNQLYGVNTMLLVLRFSSVFALSSVVGPLQLALFRMFVDLVIILIQFGFVISAFSLAITKIYKAEMSYLIPTEDHTGNVTSKAYCKQGAFKCLFKASKQLIWSVFGLTELKDMYSSTSSASEVALVLYFAFLILSVIMLVNMLVALLTNTYDSVKTNAEVEWKFYRAVVENQYRNLHSIVVPFNLLTVPVAECYYKFDYDHRKKYAEARRKQYKQFYRERLFPTLTERYLKKYGGSFHPLSVEDKIDFLVMDKMNIMHSDDSTVGIQAREEFEKTGTNP